MQGDVSEALTKHRAVVRGRSDVAYRRGQAQAEHNKCALHGAEVLWAKTKSAF